MITLTTHLQQGPPDLAEVLPVQPWPLLPRASPALTWPTFETLSSSLCSIIWASNSWCNCSVKQVNNCSLSYTVAIWIPQPGFIRTPDLFYVHIFNGQTDHVTIIVWNWILSLVFGFHLNIRSFANKIIQIPELSSVAQIVTRITF